MSCADIPSHSFPHSTPLCELLGCQLPLVLAGMGGVARSDLVIAFTRAGGFGFLGMVREPVELIEQEVRRVREQTLGRFGVNLIPAGTEPGLLQRQVQRCIELDVPVVGLFWDVRREAIEPLLDAGIKVVHQVGSIAQAMAAQEAGVHALIAQGVEAGGHVYGRQTLESLLAQVLAVADIPVAAAGGIATGEAVAKVLSQGAQAAVLGTVMLATQESFAHPYHKQRLVEAGPQDTVLTEDFHINWPSHAAVRVLRNSVTRGERGDPHAQPSRQVIGHEEERPIYQFSTDSPLRSMTGDFEAMALYAGLGCKHISRIPAAADRMEEIMQQARREWRRLHPPETALSSPVCYASQFERERDADLIARLNELLEAERARVRVTVQTLAHVQDQATRKLLEAVQQDGVQWCVMLLHAIRSMGAQPSHRTGDFFQKAMAIAAVNERLVFLNRGQGWVEKKLREILPLVDDPTLSVNLKRMLDAHVEHLEKVNHYLAAR